jgi:hypothetical protein
MGIINRLFGNTSPDTKIKSPIIQDNRPLMYSWVINGRLAIGPMPQSEAHWQQLSQSGFRSRFSCCYPEEEIFAPPPVDWLQAGVPLPDHRRQEELRPERLEQALVQAETIINQQPATYLHCFAGRERSALVATGLLARIRHVDVLEALGLIRQCHPRATPIYSDLDILDKLLSAPQKNSETT